MVDAVTEGVGMGKNGSKEPDITANFAEAIINGEAMELFDGVFSDEVWQDLLWDAVKSGDSLGHIEDLGEGDQMTLKLGAGIKGIEKSLAGDVIANVIKKDSGYDVFFQGDLKAGIGRKLGQSDKFFKALINSQANGSMGGEIKFHFADESEVNQFMTIAKKLPTEMVVDTIPINGMIARMVPGHEKYLLTNKDISFLQENVKRFGVRTGLALDIKGNLGGELPLWDSQIQALLNGEANLSAKRGLYIDKTLEGKDLIYEWDVSGGANWGKAIGVGKRRKLVSQSKEASHDLKVIVQKRFNLDNNQDDELFNAVKTSYQDHKTNIKLLMNKQSSIDGSGVRKTIEIQPENLTHFIKRGLFHHFLLGDIDKGVAVLEKNSIPFTILNQQYKSCGKNYKAEIGSDNSFNAKAYVTTEMVDVGGDDKLCK